LPFDVLNNLKGKLSGQFPGPGEISGLTDVMWLHYCKKVSRQQTPLANSGFLGYPSTAIDVQSQYGIVKRLEVSIMKFSTDIKPISFLKSNAADMLTQVNETHRPIVITQNGVPRAVLQDPESYENMRNTIGLMKLISLGEEDILQGKSKKQDEVFSALEKRVGS
jgi:prevent-host-death family protein